ncbi:MAG: hypothetical protein K0S67_8 [Nitrososphaeraceae archaeon]|jgi:hypothetical protein|nr:hypothetical protein [Nitrososphaeraceae archaeon]
MDNSNENQLMQLRELNNLLYYRPSQSSLFSERVQKLQVFQNLNVAAGGTSQIIINADDYVSGPTSYLRVTFDLVKTGATVTPIASVWGQNGSPLNIISSMRIDHRSGESLEYMPFYGGQYMNILRWYLYNEAERKQLDGLLNQNYVNTLSTAGTYSYTALIPMSLIFGCFATNTVIPPAFLSGAKITLVFNTSVAAIANSSFTYGNINCSLLFDSVRVYDAVKKQIATEMASSEGSGIQFCFDTYYQTSTNLTLANATNTGFSFDINQANSIVKNAFAVFLQASDLASSSKSKNMFKNVVSLQQWRLGSTFYPNQQIVCVPYTACGTSADVAVSAIPNSVQAYQNTLLCFDSQSKQFASYLNTNTVTMDHFVNLKEDAATVPTDSGNLSVYGQLLDRSPALLSFSGVSSNNSRLLTYTGNAYGLTTDAAGAFILVVWTTSTRCANLIQDSCIVDK